MKISLPSAISFSAGGFAALLAWAFVWPRTHPPAPASPPPASSPQRGRTSPDLSQLIASLDNAATPRERLQASLRFQDFPLADIPAALESIPLVHDRQLTHPAKLLLSRWAYHDGPAAANWSWLRFRDGGPWREAWNEIGASWAASDPSGLAKWSLEHLKDQPMNDPTLAEALASDAPLLSSSHLRRISSWIVSTEPELAYRTLLTIPGWSSDDHKLADSLTTSYEIRQALSAFKNLDQLEPYRMRGNEQLQAHTLLSRWREIDPEDFARSPYTHLFPEPPSAPLPSRPLQASWVSEFSAWQRQNPSSPLPDMTGWPAAKKQAWEDLQSLHKDGSP